LLDDGGRAQQGDEILDMIDLDVKCRRCGKPMTLRVGGEQARKIFQQEGALCSVCYTTNPRAGSTSAQATPTPDLAGS
jgi:hypothetical protein